MPGKYCMKIEGTYKVWQWIDDISVSNFQWFSDKYARYIIYARMNTNMWVIYVVYKSKKVHVAAKVIVDRKYFKNWQSFWKYKNVRFRENYSKDIKIWKYQVEKAFKKVCSIKTMVV